MAVIRKLQPQQREAVLSNGWTDIGELDFATLIAVFLAQENLSALKSVIKIHPEMIDLAKHIKRIRNINAHRGAKEIINTDEKDIRYHLDTLERFLAKLNVSDKDVQTVATSSPTKKTDKPLITTLKRKGCTIVAS